MCLSVGRSGRQAQKGVTNMAVSLDKVKRVSLVKQGKRSVSLIKWTK